VKCCSSKESCCARRACSFNGGYGSRKAIAGIEALHFVALTGRTIDQSLICQAIYSAKVNRGIAKRDESTSKPVSPLNMNLIGLVLDK
jgi:hypothetical protein